MARIVGLTDKVIAERKKAEAEADKKKTTHGTKTEAKAKG